MCYFLQCMYMNITIMWQQHGKIVFIYFNYCFCKLTITLYIFAPLTAYILFKTFIRSTAHFHYFTFSFENVFIQKVLL